MKLIIDNTVFNYKEIFSQFGEIYAMSGKEISKQDLKNSDILIVRSRTQVNKELLDGTSICFVGSAVSGTDHIDLQYLSQNNIVFSDGLGSNANSVAEYVIANILNVAYEYNFNVTDKVLGIIGVGKVGTELLKKATALSMSVVLNDPFKTNTSTMKYESLDYVLNYADIISFHVPLTYDGAHPTYKLLAEHNFHLPKANAVIINTARGRVIDEKAWLKHQGIKIIDCWTHEPCINTKLAEQAFLSTPHIAGHSLDAKFSGSVMIYNALCDFLNIDKQHFTLNANIKPITGSSLRNKINTIYNFKQDEKALFDGEFEAYRGVYPARYEWHNYNLLL